MNLNFSGTVFTFIFCLFFIPANAQENDVDLLVGDLLKVFDDFALPAAEATAYQSNSGWFSSAKPLRLWEIDFSIHGNLLFVPAKKTTSTVNNANFEIIKIRGAETANIPTAFGGETDVFFDGEVNFFGEPTQFEFQALEGLGKKSVYHSFFQIAVGLPFGTEFSARFAPEISSSEVKIFSYGMAVKHNFNQYFSNSSATDFQFAALLSYTNFDVDYEYDPMKIGEIVVFDALQVHSDLWSLQLISSKTFTDSGWEIFGALGIANSNFEYELGGNGIALEGMNKELKKLGDNEITLQGHLGLNYSINEFMISSELVFGEYYNGNMSLHFRFW